MRRALFVLLLMIGMVVGGIQMVRAASDGFTVIDLPGSTFTEARGINDRGEIVGDYDAGRHGFLLSDGTFTTIDSPACPVPFPFGSQIIVYGINNRSQAVGVYNPCGT
jgi:hypothetical protein